VRPPACCSSACCGSRRAWRPPLAEQTCRGIVPAIASWRSRMTQYLGTPDYTHGSSARVGVLLVNLGTPEDPSPRSVRKFLAEFLRDPRIIEMPRALWWLILHGVILRVRPAPQCARLPEDLDRRGLTAAGRIAGVDSRTCGRPGPPLWRPRGRGTCHELRPAIAQVDVAAPCANATCSACSCCRSTRSIRRRLPAAFSKS
jgi:hypothetical protein